METKQRHGCVTAWLILMIIANSLSGAAYLFMGDTISQNISGGITTPILLLLAGMCILNVVLAVMLFQWKKWAFWAFIGTSLVGFIINMSMGLGLGSALFGFVGVAVLFGILQMRQNGVSAWENLEE